MSFVILGTLAAVSNAGSISRGSSAVNSGSNYHGLSNANANVGFARRNAYMATGQQPAEQAPQNNVPIHRDQPNMRLRPNGGAGGWTAWGIIAVIVCVIVLGFCGYYGIICYPLFMDKGNRYDHMDVNSTTTTTSTPTKMDYDVEDFQGYPKLSSEKGQWATAN